MKGWFVQSHFHSISFFLFLLDWVRETAYGSGGPPTSSDTTAATSSTSRRNQLKSRLSLSSSYPPPSYSSSSHSSSRHHHPFPRQLSILSFSPLPTYDIYCFEAFFHTLKTLLKQEIILLQSLMNPILERFHNFSYFSFFIPIELQSSMKSNNQHLSLLTHRLNRVIYSLKEILENDNNLIKINLSLFHDNPQYYQ
jgi:hypothetical protein